MMAGLASTVVGGVTSGYTSNGTNSRPWATAIVFRPDGHNSNQHLWNVGEGLARITSMFV